MGLVDLPQALSAMGGEKRIILEYHKHKGNRHQNKVKEDNECESEIGKAMNKVFKLKAILSHPRNLLKDDAEYGYESAERSVVGDWITFRLQNVKRVIPKKIGIMNSRYSEG